MATVQVTEKAFEATVKQGIVLLDVVFGKVDTQAERGLAAAFQVRARPRHEWV